MIRMMIVDDEMLSRTVIKSMVGEHFPKIEIVAEAENGRQAVQLAQLYEPDVVIMDIRMPSLNGIEASKLILKGAPKTQVLLLSAYDSFEYIKEAMELKFAGYILKPINLLEFKGKVEFALDNIHKGRQQSSQTADIKKNLEIARPIVEKELVNAYISGDSENISDIEKYHSFLQLEINAGFFVVIYLKQEHSRLGGNIRFEIVKTKLVSEIFNVLKSTRAGFVGDYTANMLPVFIPLPPNCDERFASYEGTLIANEILRRASPRLSLEVCVALGEIQKEIPNFKKSYIQAVSLLGSPQLGEVLIHSELPQKTIKVAYPYELENELLKSIKQGDFEAASSISERITNALFSSCCTFEQRKDYYMELLILLKRQLSKLGLDFDQIVPPIRISQIEAIADNSQLYTFGTSSLKGVCELLRQKENNKNLALFHKINNYIQNGDSALLSLEGLSKELNLTMQYVSKVFKEEFGKNFVEYVTDIRIEEAKRRLKESDDSVSVIAAIVGYSDSNYFCRVFKRVTGLTPIDYRKLR